MIRTIKPLLCTIALIAIASLIACGGSSGGSGGGSNPGEGDSATLSTTDFPNAGVCATGSTDVTAQGLLDMLAAATQFEFLQKPYGGDDADISFICGLNAVWDPNDANAFVKSSIYATTTLIADFLSVTFAPIYICNTGFGFQAGATATAGLHEAETYRTELILSDGASSVRIRIRFTASGTDVGKTLASLGLSGADFSLTAADGTVLTTVADVLALFAASPGSITLNLVSGTPATTHLTALGRIICWE